jgi:hypothetical protein
MKGSIEKISGKFLVWSAGELENGIPPGYISRNGGFTKDPDNAQKFEGCGEAIRVAQTYQVAITSW